MNSSASLQRASQDTAGRHKYCKTCLKQTPLKIEPKLLAGNLLMPYLILQEKVEQISNRLAIIARATVRTQHRAGSR